MTAGSHKENNTEALAKSMQQGSREAFSMLYDKYAPALLGLINGLFDDMNVSEEILHKSFVRMWRQKEDYDAGVTTIFTWMVQITRNTALETMAEKTKAELKVRRNIYTVSGGPFHHYERSPILSAPKGNDVLHLVFVKGYSYDEAASELNIPVEILKTKIRSAIKQTAATII